MVLGEERRARGEEGMVKDGAVIRIAPGREGRGSGFLGDDRSCSVVGNDQRGKGRGEVGG